MNPVYALNLFDVSNRDEYLAYSKRSAKEHRVNGTSGYVWRFFDKLEDPRPILK